MHEFDEEYKENFSKLYELYKTQLKSEGAVEPFILQEDLLLDAGESGVYAMLSVLYKNHEKSASLYDYPFVSSDDPEVGLSEEVIKVASRLLNRIVVKEDLQVLFNIRVVKHVVSDEVFESIVELTSKPK